MSSQGDATLPATRRSRKSIGSGPSSTKRTGDKDNATLDLGTAMGATRKKSRSKSIGPGGLDVLKTGNGNRRASLAVPSGPLPRSILKPTIPILPDIPTYKAKAPSPNNDSSVGTKVALRTEEEQQAAAREREERERKELEKEIKDRREARRKSLANRRVSFAAEATLHTFHEVEENQETSAPPANRHDAPDSDPPSSPSQHSDDDVGNQRRNSGAASIYGEDDTITSVYDSDMEHADEVAEMEGEEMTGSSDSDEDGTVMTVEAEEMTSASMASVRSAFSTGDSTDSLDDILRLAQQRASATKGIDEDEEVIAGFVGWGKKPSSQSKENTSNTTQDMPTPQPVNSQDEGSDMEMDMDADMEITKAVGGIIRHQSASPEKDQGEEMDMDMSMDVTKALGGIISKPKAQNRRKSIKPVQDEFEDQTMEFTTAVGGIQQRRLSNVSRAETDLNEDMSMEFTAAIGGFLGNVLSKNNPPTNRRKTIAKEEGQGMEMDMTVGVGRILPTADVEMEDGEMDETMGMDMTMAVGGIIKSVTADSRSAAKKVMEQEADEPDSSITPSAELATSPRRQAVATDDNLTLGLSGFQGKGLRRSLANAWGDRSPDPLESSPLKSSPVRSSPVRSAKKSPARRTPSPARKNAQDAVDLHKTPPSMIRSRSSSPVRDPQSPAKATPRSVTRQKLFHQNPSTGVSTPRVVLTPKGRRLSGVGADRPGLGSPRVAEIFDRRESLGDSASKFVPSQPTNGRRVVAFTDPRVIEAEVDREREDEKDKENGRSILEREVNGSQEERDVTLNIREMIQNLSPKKNILRGRKSLHVGSARGLLGKRPMELEEDEDIDETDGVKRLKGHQASPVKHIRLQSPPSKAETTTGRKTRASTRNLEDNDTITPVVESSPHRATTPQHQGRFKDVANDQPTNPVDFDHTEPGDEEHMQAEGDAERIHLQDFLNLTSIRFMELTTTKRRHTVAPGEATQNMLGGGDDDLSLERCVVAGACTVPTLELYQHSCRELKKYISEGRRIVKEIESETFEENPPLFREYMTASPEFKVLMDNQFKNVKTHARLLSKAMWYEWRMKLQDGLKEGLIKISEGMDNDEMLLAKQQELLDSVLPEMVKYYEKLKSEHHDLEALERELAETDPMELEQARKELISLDKSFAEKTKKLAELQRQLEESTASIETNTMKKQQCLDEIREADKIREECRGWSSEEINKLKAQTDKIEKKHGWAITGISGSTISMSYKRQIELVFDIASFQRGEALSNSRKSRQNTPTDIWYIADKREGHQALVLTTEKEFFLQAMRDHVRALPQSSTHVKHMLGIVSAAWDNANTVANYVRLLNLSFPTTVTRTSDSSIAVTASLLLVPLQTRVEAVLNLKARSGEAGVEAVVNPEARVIYGEPFTVGKMTEFLNARVGGAVGEDSKNGAGEKVGWDLAVLELYKRLLAKGARAAQK
ncbi:kinetochore protein spc7 [Podospora fimiseda]|uniref:Kinetochore protein spc7 n=1 Tax=Podospora fimiseda TaxID=252190 RepID=A0AAN7BU51_9PEZI|nr:kinetochore protein spc7 [Podospora fimiseda]